MVSITRTAQLNPKENWPEPLVSVVIPAKNDALNLPRALGGLQHDLHEVILVDGGSTDDTVEVARRYRPDIIVVRQNRTGKGNALACGFQEATGDFIVMIDADGSTDPAEIPRFVNALKEGADFAKGSRFLPGGSGDVSPFQRLGIYILNTVINLLCGTRYTDIDYGFTAFRRECLFLLGLDEQDAAEIDKDSMPLGDGLEIETWISVRLAKAGVRVAEVPSVERSRPFGVSKRNGVRGGLRILWVLWAIQAEKQRGVS